MPIPRVTVAAASLYAAFAWIHAMPAHVGGGGPQPRVVATHVAGAKPIKGHVTGTVKETLIAAPATYRLEVSASGPTSLGGVARTSWELPEVTLDLANSILQESVRRCA